MPKNPGVKKLVSKKDSAPSNDDAIPLSNGGEPPLLNGDREADRKRRCSWEHVPNAETVRALRGAEAGQDMTDYASVDEMFKDLDI